MIQKHLTAVSGFVVAAIVGLIGFASDLGLITPEDVCPPVPTETTQ